jgi:hypothetical protein
MSASSSHNNSRGPLLCAGVISIGCACLHAQNFSMQVANPDPLGLRSVLLSGDDTISGLTDGIKGGFATGAAFQAIYDSNFFLREDDPTSELSASLSPFLNYTSDPEGGAPMKLTANYSPAILLYSENSDLNGIDHSGNIRFLLQKPKTSLSAFVNYSEISGTDRITREFVNGALFGAGIQATYQIAPRTSIQSDSTVSISDYGSGAVEGARIFSTQVSGFWNATERLSFGPALGYSRAESDNIDSRDAYSFSMQAKYLVGSKIRLRGNLGLEHAANEGVGEEDTLDLIGGLEASYSINERWSWNASLQYATIPSPTDQGFLVNNLAISSSLSRSLNYGSLGFGAEMNLSTYERVGSNNTNIEDDNTLGLFISYRRPLFLERVGFDSSLIYSVNDGNEDWSRVRVSAGLVVTF